MHSCFYRFSTLDENIQTVNKQVTNDFVAVLTIGAVSGADPADGVRELEDAEPRAQRADPRRSLRHAELRAHRRARPGREGSRGKLHQVSGGGGSVNGPSLCSHLILDEFLNLVLVSLSLRPEAANEFYDGDHDNDKESDVEI